jgi:glutaconyl-CoA decarboxylase
MKYKIEVNGKTHDVEVEEKGAGYMVTVDGIAYKARIEEVAATPQVQWSPVAVQPPSGSVPPVPVHSPHVPGSVAAPMPGTVLKVHVSPGDTVSVGDVLLTLEAMKMENEISSPTSGTVENVHVKEGQSVNTGDALLVIS